MKRTTRALAKLLERQFNESRRDIPAGQIRDQLPGTTLPPGGPAGIGYPPDPHDHTSSTDGGKLTNDVHDGYSAYEEIAAPSSPAANTARLYTKDVAGVTEFFYKNSAGTERDLSAPGTVSSVALTVPADMAVSGSPITTSGTLAITRSNQTANLVLAGPASGGAATPAYRALVALDTPAAAILAAANVFTAAQKIRVEDADTNTVPTLVSIGHNSSGTPIAGFGAALDFQLETSTTDNQNAARVSSFWTDVTHATRTSVLAFATTLSGTLAERARLTGAGALWVGRTSGGLSGAGDLDVIGNAAIGGTLTLPNQSANQMFAGPTSGGAATPAFRALVAADVPSLDASKITSGALAVTRGGTGVSALPAFSVYKNTNQTGIVTATFTKVSWQIEVFDNNANFASDKFTPTIAGKYLLSCSLVWNETAMENQKALLLDIYKNGARAKTSLIQSNGAGKQQGQNITVVLDANGSTDYFEVFVYHECTANQALFGTSDGFHTHFSGAWAAP